MEHDHLAQVVSAKSGYLSVRSGDLLNRWVSLPVEVSKTKTTPMAWGRFFGPLSIYPIRKRDVLQSDTRSESPRINHPSIGSRKSSDSPTWGVCRLEGLMLSSSLRHPRDPQYPTDNVTQFVTEVLEGDWGPCADNRPKKIFLNHGVISYKLRSHSVRVLGFWLRWFLPLFGENLY